MLSYYPEINYIIKDDDSIQISNIDCRAVVPRLIDYLDDGLDDMSPIVLVGYRGMEPVYRVTNTFATEREGLEDGQVQVHWPALFPTVIIPVCQYLQLDVTFRNCDPYELFGMMEDDDDIVKFDYYVEDDMDYYIEDDSDDDDDDDNDDIIDTKYMLMQTFELDNIRWWE